MWLQIQCPAFPDGAVITVSHVHAAPGVQLQVGDPVIDLQVDASAGDWMDCPAVSTCRISLREAAWVRSLDIGIGQSVEENAVLALLSIEPDEAEQPAQRRARINAATILSEDDWWA